MSGYDLPGNGIESANTSAFYKGESQEKNFSGDWKERRCSPCSPAQVVLRASGAFVGL